MSNDNGNRTGGPAPTWVTHAYPTGEQPAAPAPLPAGFWAEETAAMDEVTAEGESSAPRYEDAAADCRAEGGA